MERIRLGVWRWMNRLGVTWSAEGGNQSQRRTDAVEQDSFQMNDSHDRHADVLDAAELLHGRVQRWQEERGIVPEDVVETLRILREERDDEIGGAADRANVGKETLP